VLRPESAGTLFPLTFPAVSYLFSKVFTSADLALHDLLVAEPRAPRAAAPGSAQEPGDGNPPMKCPYCGHVKDRVVDSRESRDGDSIRRRRQCLHCARRFTSYERIDEIPYMVVKKDGGREKFERNKILSGLLKACEKRPVSLTQLEKVVDTIEQQVQESPEREIDSVAIGKTLLQELRRLDKVAYLRFASVYLEFEDVAEFMREINELFEKKT
jgi:transcriptional repressor NrdR